MDVGIPITVSDARLGVQAQVCIMLISLLMIFLILFSLVFKLDKGNCIIAIVVVYAI
jgi:hypothetical protein